MNLKGILSISGKGGLYLLVSSRKSGVLAQPLSGGRTELVPSRKHQFTPLESISIYTDDGEATALTDVLTKMREQIEDNPPPDPKASSATLREYMLDVLPQHDQERVYTSDIRKLVKWYGLLDEAGKLDEAPEDDASEQEAAGQPDAASAEHSASNEAGSDEAGSNEEKAADSASEKA